MITAHTTAPESGIVGDHQRIYLHWEKVDRMPALRWDGIPQLC